MSVHTRILRLEHRVATDPQHVHVAVYYVDPAGVEPDALAYTVCTAELAGLPCPAAQRAPGQLP